MQNQAMAQFVYLAQLEAERSKCTCKTCQLLRKGTEASIAQALAEPQKAPNITLESLGGQQD